jgi:hypothetical protein
MPLLVGLSAAAFAATRTATAERRLLFSIALAAFVEIGVVKAMVWTGQPALLIVVLLLNAFMTFQFLRYGCEYLFEL